VGVRVRTASATLYAAHVDARAFEGFERRLRLLLFALFPLSLPVALGYVVFLGIGGGFAQQPFFQLWSGEMFPTLMRSTAQGLTFAVVRIGLGIWSFLVPAITAAGFHTLAWILTGFVTASALLGLLFAPSNAGKSRSASRQATDSRPAGWHRSGP
jgi:MFS family permease